ncbi:facilitated trehalose transporter Tret1-like [Aphomia sociella]
MMEHSLVLSFNAILLPQLRQDPDIEIDINTESWIASIMGISMIPGVLIGPSIMTRYGRRKANLVSAIIMTFGWFLASISYNSSLILASKFIQGMSLGITSLSATILIGEYTTPRYRGTFLACSIFATFLSGFVVHTIGLYVYWKRTALFCLGIAILDSIIVTISPETPVFLASRGRYEECKKVFRWLRGPDEEKELLAMIDAAILNKVAESKRKIHRNVIKIIGHKVMNVVRILKKSEFFKPLILMLHLNLIELWSGYVMMESFATDIFHKLLGHDVDVAGYVITMDICKLLSCMSAIIIHTKFRRRLMLKVFVGINISAYIFTGIFSCFKASLGIFGHPFVGASLIYLLIFSTCAGTIPLVATISSEIFPLEYKPITAMITTLFMSVNFLLKMKSLSYLFSSLGLHGAFFVYASILSYGLTIAWIMLPETKDKTLQNIEEEYWTKRDCGRELAILSLNEETVILKDSVKQ